jgi:hypothetical protein
MAAPVGPVAQSAIRLVDVAAPAGLTVVASSGTATKDYLVDSTGTGAAFFDFDNDGDLDALIVRGSSLERLAKGGDQMVALYRNQGSGRFIDVTATSGMTRRGWGSGVCVADYDNDGLQDVYVTAYGPNVLWRNAGKGRFMATAEAADGRWSTGCAFGDYDRDGFVDLYVANYVEFDVRTVPRRGTPACRFMNVDINCGPRFFAGQPDILYRNTGKGRFVDVSKQTGAIDPGHYGFGVLFTDLNSDGWLDIYVANDSVPNLFFRNKGDGTFSEDALLSGLAVRNDGREQAGMGVEAGDYDGDGRLDLVKTNFSQDYTTLYHNQGGGLFDDASISSGISSTQGPYLGWGVGFIDIDNNGRLDIFIANGHLYPDIGKTKVSTYLQRNQIFYNEGKGRFRHVAPTAANGLQIQKSSRGAAFGDYDNDGDIDILVVNIDDRPTLLRNDTTGGHWLTLKLTGTKSNRDAIGALVTIEAGGARQVAEVRSGGSYISHNDMRVHFGLGSANTVDRLTIRWPNGLTETATKLAADRFYTAREGSGVQPLTPTK